MDWKRSDIILLDKYDQNRNRNHQFQLKILNKYSSHQELK